MFKVTLGQLPDTKRTGTGSYRQSQPLTVANVAKILELSGVCLRKNMMTNRFEFSGPCVGKGVNGQEVLYGRLEDTLTMLDIGGFSRLPDILTLLANANAYHPMEDWILATPWDGKDRLKELADTIDTDSHMWPHYLRRWLIQVVEGVSGWREDEERSIPHVLVFVGGQGAGKGRWLRQLAPGFVMADAELHLSSVGAKDFQMQVLSYPVVELGEIDSSIKKSEVSAMKSFLSRPIDTIRAPYARNAVDRPRMTVFAGSVNNMEFLTDPTGARRFWPIHLTGKLNWDHGIDMQQLFAQVNVIWESGEDWNLGDVLEDERADEMSMFIQQSAAVDLVEGHYFEYKSEYEFYAILNKTTIGGLVGAGMHPAGLSNITEWLTKNLGPHRKLKGHKGAGRSRLGRKMSHIPLLRDQPFSAKKRQKSILWSTSVDLHVSWLVPAGTREWRTLAVLPYMYHVSVYINLLSIIYIYV